MDDLIDYTPPPEVLQGSPANVRYAESPFKKKVQQPEVTTSSPPVRSSASRAEPPSAKRKRVKSPGATLKTPGATPAKSAASQTRASLAAEKPDSSSPHKVEVDVLVDGVSVLEEPVAVPENVEALVEESKAHAAELVESLKAEGKLEETTRPKRALEVSDGEGVVALVEPARIEPRTRRYISIAGALALGAATFAAPYFLS